MKPTSRTPEVSSTESFQEISKGRENYTASIARGEVRPPPVADSLVLRACPKKRVLPVVCDLLVLCALYVTSAHVERTASPCCELRALGHQTARTSSVGPGRQPIAYAKAFTLCPS